MRLLTVGGGSIGKRHLQNFKSLGVQHLGVVDTREDRRDDVRAKVGVQAAYADLDSALADGYDAVVIGVPTAYHTDAAIRSVRAGAHVLIEKPLSDTLDGLDVLEQEARERGRVLLVGYTYRFWPPLLRAKAILQAGSLGRVCFAEVMFSEYLPDWHPWEDYRAWFMSKKEQGGGALLDESHAVDLARFLLGEIVDVFCATGNLSPLEMTADDYAQLVVTFQSGAKGTIHMDLFGRRHRRSMFVWGSEGTLEWDFFANTLRIDRPGVEPAIERFTCERNDMFVAEAKHFLDCIAGAAPPTIPLADGIATLRVLLAGRESSRDGRVVSLG